jgi:transposase-like protein
LGLIVTDGNKGLENAVDSIYPQIPRQRCWAHKLRNVSNYLKKKHQDKCVSEARSIYDAKDRKEAVRAYNKWAAKWRSVSPKAVGCIENDLEELLNFYLCPKEMWIKLRTTNVIERAFKGGKEKDKAHELL